METEIEKLTRLIKCELNTIKTLKKKKKDLDRLIKHAEKNAIKLLRKRNKINQKK